MFQKNQELSIREYIQCIICGSWHIAIQPLSLRIVRLLTFISACLLENHKAPFWAEREQTAFRYQRVKLKVKRYVGVSQQLFLMEHPYLIGACLAEDPEIEVLLQLLLTAPHSIVNRIGRDLSCILSKIRQSCTSHDNHNYLSRGRSGSDPPVASS